MLFEKGRTYHTVLEHDDDCKIFTNEYRCTCNATLKRIVTFDDKQAEIKFVSDSIKNYNSMRQKNESK